MSGTYFTGLCRLCCKEDSLFLLLKYISDVKGKFFNDCNQCIFLDVCPILHPYLTLKSYFKRKVSLNK